MGRIGDSQRKAHALECTGKMPGQPVSPTRLICLIRPDSSDQVAGIDAYRATLGTQSGSSAAVDALVLISGFQLARINARAFLGLNVTPDNNALAWCLRPPIEGPV